VYDVVEGKSTVYLIECTIQNPFRPTLMHLCAKPFVRGRLF
jgi:hypothetical protein